jgi:hypothetical protein
VTFRCEALTAYLEIEGIYTVSLPLEAVVDGGLVTGGSNSSSTSSPEQDGQFGGQAMGRPVSWLVVLSSGNEDGEPTEGIVNEGDVDLVLGQRVLEEVRVPSVAWCWPWIPSMRGIGLGESKRTAWDGLTTERDIGEEVFVSLPSGRVV